MRNTLVASCVAATVIVAPVAVRAQSSSAPLLVTATVISSCRVELPLSADASQFPTFPVDLQCARGLSARPRIERVAAVPHTTYLDGLVVINF